VLQIKWLPAEISYTTQGKEVGMEAIGKRTPKKVTSYLSVFLRLLSKPQRKHFLGYLVGLIGLIKFHSTREISRRYLKTTPDNLQRFLNARAGNVSRIASASQDWLATSCTFEETLLIIDDTTVERQGPAIKGIGIHHSGNGLIKGQCAVTCIVRIGGQWFGWDIRGYCPKTACPKGTFQSKIDLAKTILTSFREQVSAPFITLMDSWYTCAPILNLISASGGIYVAAIKRNRYVEIHGVKKVVSHLAKGPRRYKTIRASKKQRFKVAKLIVFLPKVGMVALFITKGAGAKARFLITNDLAMTEARVVASYKQRFRIEVFHKEIKQHLAFGQVFMRSWQGVQTHWTLAMIAYNLITLSARKRLKGFRQKISHFRDSDSFQKMYRLSKTVN